MKKGGRISKIMLIMLFSIIQWLMFELFLFPSPAYLKERRWEHIRLATPRTQNMSFLSFQLGKKKGIYEKEGIDLEILVMKTAMAITGVRAGDVDHVAPLGTSIRAAAAGIPIKVVLVIQDKPPHILVSRSGINTVKELKGKVIGVGSIGSSTDRSVKEIVRNHGLDPDKDITLIDTGPDIMLAALLAGSVDAILTVPPQNIIARQRGFRELVHVADELKTETPGTGIGLTTTDKKIRERKEEIKKMIRASLKAVTFVKKNREESLDFMIRNWGLAKDIAFEVYQVGVRLLKEDGITSERGIMDEIKMARESGFKIEPNIPITKIVDFSIFKEVQKELGIPSSQ